jgi:5-methylcytosine-specific restriction endonuclease McrA
MAYRHVAVSCCEDGCDQPRKPRQSVLGQFYTRCEEHYAEYNRRRVREYKEAHPEWDKESKDRWYRDHFEQQQIRNKQYYQDRKIAITVKAVRHAKNHMEQTKGYRRKWKKVHIEQVRRETRERRARRNGTFSTFYKRDEIFVRDAGICQICFSPVDSNDWHLDHIIPLGPGSDTPDNVRVTCPGCNLKKIPQDKKILKEWKEEQDQFSTCYTGPLCTDTL